MLVIKVADKDVADKVDTRYIAEQFPDLQEVGIVYICTSEGGEEDDWIDEWGVRHIAIQLPYPEVMAASDIRPLMLARARERLGQIS